MKLKDINRTAIDPKDVTLINESALKAENKRLELVLNNVRYSFYYLDEDDLLEDYKTIYDLKAGA